MKLKNKNEKEIKDFYQNLRKKINDQLNKRKNENEKDKNIYDKLVNYLFLLPDLFHLSFKLLFDKEVPIENKGALIAGIVYVISPIDLIPDYISIAGWIDDLIVLTIAVNKFLETENESVKIVIDKHWAGNDDVFKIIKEILMIAEAAMEFLPQKIMKIVQSMFPKK